ncbi:hypothetical protein ACWCXH_12875 [Kitasatospora sp. NPDC001660]
MKASSIGLASLLAVLPLTAAPARAEPSPPSATEPSITLTPDHGPVATAVDVVLSGFDACLGVGEFAVSSSSIDISWDTAKNVVTSIPITAAGPSPSPTTGGAVTGTFNVPDAAATGPHDVKAGCALASTTKTATFTVTSPGPTTTSPGPTTTRPTPTPSPSPSGDLAAAAALAFGWRRLLRRARKPPGRVTAVLSGAGIVESTLTEPDGPAGPGHSVLLDPQPDPGRQTLEETPDDRPLDG